MGPLNYQAPARGLARQLFGPSRGEVWHQFAQGIGGRYVEGGLWRSDKVEVDVGPSWTVTLDTFTESRGEHGATFVRASARPS